MCVIGAGRRARRGESLEAILAQYYPNLQLTDLAELCAVDAAGSGRTACRGEQLGRRSVGPARFERQRARFGTRRTWRARDRCRASWEPRPVR